MCLGALAVIMYLIFNLKFRRQKSEDNNLCGTKNKRDWV